MPLYQHPCLVAKDSNAKPGSYVNPDDGSITDSDDHVWIDDKSVLGGANDWAAFDAPNQLALKRSRSVSSTVSSMVMLGDKRGSPRPRFEDSDDDEEVDNSIYK
jgi:hypothetical protein